MGSEPSAIVVEYADGAIASAADGTAHRDIPAAGRHGRLRSGGAVVLPGGLALGWVREAVLFQSLGWQRQRVLLLLRTFSFDICWGFAKSLSIGSNKPFIPINHLEAHVLSTFFNNNIKNIELNINNIDIELKNIDLYKNIA